MLIYDGDKEAQDHFWRLSNGNTAGVGAGPGTKLERVDEDEWVDIRHRPSRTHATTKDEQHDIDQTRTSSARRSKSVEYDTISHRSRPRRGSAHSHQAPTASNTKRIRGEVNIRVVDFAHTTTGHDFIPFPPTHVDPPEQKLGKGYDTQIDPDTGLNLARFPPKHLHQPDMGFVFGLKNVCAALEGLWRDAAGDQEVDRWFGGMENREVFFKAFGQDGELQEGELST